MISQIKYTIFITKTACESDRVQEYLFCSSERNKVPLFRHFVINVAVKVKVYDELTSVLMNLI